MRGWRTEAGEREGKAKEVAHQGPAPCDVALIDDVAATIAGTRCNGKICAALRAAGWPARHRGRALRAPTAARAIAVRGATR
ncbi:hypothetical protein Rmf_03360 [Roseomonas fluvialis]|uniref:Transposase n=1 Tax=Roseomonas fluvialis TaxID=1750527 RepID=A0ABM7XY63_9PROT|nr:hypothetical protein Rmf_03360 [Roseomonas fluvialis]